MFRIYYVKKICLANIFLHQRIHKNIIVVHIYIVCYFVFVIYIECQAVFLNLISKMFLRILITPLSIEKSSRSAECYWVLCPANRTSYQLVYLCASLPGLVVPFSVNRRRSLNSFTENVSFAFAIDNALGFLIILYVLQKKNKKSPKKVYL